MKSITENIYIAALLSCPTIGISTIKKLIQKFGSAEAVWNIPKNDLKALFRLGEKATGHIGSKELYSKAEEEINYCRANGIKVISYWEEGYPFLLKECTDAPALLYTKGNIDWAKQGISIVGTRKMTAYGKKFTEELVEVLKEKNVNIISGLALGIDGTAHKKAVELEVSTVGVLAHGLNNFYPPQHKMLAEDMLKNGGYITEFPLSARPDRYNFIQRNRIIAGLSPITIIVESAYGGGAISTVKFANSYNREVYALPGRVTDIESQGCNKLIKNLEAQIITRPEDIAELIEMENGGNKKEIQTQLFVNLTPNEQKVADHLKEKGKLQIDQLALELNQATFQLMPTLLELELKNIIRPLPGKYFELL